VKIDTGFVHHKTWLGSQL